MDFIVTVISALEQDQSPVAIPLHVRVWILDFPDAEAQQENIKSITSSSKATLLKRAVESPSELSAKEIDLLKIATGWISLQPRGRYSPVPKAACSLCRTSTSAIHPSSSSGCEH